MTKASKEISEPLISIIVPVYNAEQYLHRCIESIVSQTYSNIEIILIDDGSNDKSGEICDEYSKKDKRIKVFHKDNTGVSDTRNFGIKKATGSYIGFVDSDDCIHRNMFQLLEENMREEVDVVICDISKKIINNLNIIDYKMEKIDIEKFTKIFFKIGTQRCEYYFCNKLFKRKLFNTKTFNEKIRVGEDTLAMYYMLKKIRVVAHVKLPLYFYIDNNTNVSSNFSEKDFDLLKVWDIIFWDAQKSNKYIEYAQLNRCRTDYTLLMRIALNYNIDDIKSMDIQRTLLENLKNNERLLLKANIPISRKLTIFLFCRDYYFFANIIRKIKDKLKR